MYFGGYQRLIKTRIAEAHNAVMIGISPEYLALVIMEALNEIESPPHQL